MEEPAQLSAGGFSEWLAETTEARASEGGVDVPCGTCTACCRSSYFIHVGPDETAARRRIPAALLFAAPGLPKGHDVMGYDERGHCPMLGETGCTIYDDRPQTCRTYDCRIFTAAGLSPLTDGKPAIAERVGRWRFDLPSDADVVEQAAVRAAAAFLSERPECFGEGGPPTSALQLALVAVKAHLAFVRYDDDGQAHLVEPDVEVVKVALRR